MRVWMHKETGELAIARAIWLEEENVFNEQLGYSVNLGSQNYAFENKHGVVLVLPPQIYSAFEDLGEL